MMQALLTMPVKRPPAPVFVPEGAAAPRPAAPTVTPPTQSVQMLVALAATSHDDRRAQAREAEEALDGLERLHAELVAGRARRERLDALKEWTRRRSRPGEPELAKLVDEIELRILVELAKQERG
jgi:hypothetical protein